MSHQQPLKYGRGSTLHKQSCLRVGKVRNSGQLSPSVGCVCVCNWGFAATDMTLLVCMAYLWETKVPGSQCTMHLSTPESWDRRSQRELSQVSPTNQGTCSETSGIFLWEALLICFLVGVQNVRQQEHWGEAVEILSRGHSIVRSLSAWVMWRRIEVIKYSWVPAKGRKSRSI